MNFKGGYTGFTSFVLSVGLWTESCPLCIFYNTGSILYLYILSSNFRMCVACNVEVEDTTSWSQWHSQYSTLQGKPTPSPLSAGGTPSSTPVKGSHHPHLLELVSLAVQHRSGEATTLPYWSWWHSQYSTLQGKPPPSPIGAGGTPQYSALQGKPPPSPIGADGTHSTAPIRGSHHPHLLKLVALPVQHPSGGSHHPHLLDMVALTVAHSSGEATTLTYWSWWHFQYSTRQGEGTTLTYWTWWHSQLHTRQGKPPPSPIGAGGTPSTAPIRGKPPPSPIGHGGTHSCTPVRGSHHPHLLELVALPVQHPSGEATTLTYWSWWHSQYSTRQGKPPPSAIGAGGTHSTAPVRGSHHPYLLWLICSEGRVTKDKCNPIQSSLLHAQHI